MRCTKRCNNVKKVLNLRYNLIYLLYEGVQNFAVYISKKRWPFPETIPSSGNSQHKLKMRKSKLKVCASRSVQVSKIEHIYSSIKNRVKPAKKLGNFIRRLPRSAYKIADIWHVRYHITSIRHVCPFPRFSAFIAANRHAVKPTHEVGRYIFFIGFSYLELSIHLSA